MPGAEPAEVAEVAAAVEEVATGESDADEEPAAFTEVSLEVPLAAPALAAADAAAVTPAAEAAEAAAEEVEAGPEEIEALTTPEPVAGGALVAGAAG